jgi:hypothetical protein
MLNFHKGIQIIRTVSLKEGGHVVVIMPEQRQTRQFGQTRHPNVRM